jgi:hypothetical protein
MTDAEFEAYLAKSVANLKAKQSYLQSEFGLTSYARFWVDYEKEELSFLDGDVLQLKFEITDVGSHVTEKNSWKWAWANQHLPEHSRKKSEKLKGLTQKTGLSIFSEEYCQIDEPMAWEFAAFACDFVGALGVYSIPHKNLRAFVLLDQILYRNEN